MATTTKFFLLVSMIINLIVFPPTRIIATDINITAIFAFGDSLVDPGNNNHLFTYTKSDRPPYGHDFPGQISTGRTSNGKLFTDFLVSKLGLKELLPAYLEQTTTSQDLLTGCSFGSSAAGIDDVTTSLSNVISLTAQLGYFEQAFERMKGFVGLKEAVRVVENGLFIIVAGTNDMAKNFYALPLRKRYSVDGYHDLLLTNLEKLYDMGARKIGAMGLLPIGCLPVQMSIASLSPGLNILHRKCVNQQNIDSQSYNAKLSNLTSRIQRTLPGSRIVYVDMYNPIMDFITNPATFGFEISNKGCCGTGLMEVDILCNSLDPICPDPSKYVFWDAVHPSQETYLYYANYLMHNELPKFAT